MNQNNMSSISVVTSGTQRASTENRLNEMHSNNNPNAGIMMNNFAGPSDTQNFADNQQIVNN